MKPVITYHYAIYQEGGENVMALYTEDDKKQALDLYDQNHNMAMTARLTGISVQTIRNWIRYDTSVKLGKEKMEQIRQMYQNGMYAKDIAKELGYNEGTMSMWIRQMGIARHRAPKSKMQCENYFHEIDTEQKAYYLGWIMSDGCISTSYNGYFLKLALQIADIEILNGFLQKIGSKHHVNIKANRAYVSIGSKEMVQDLMALGMQERNSGKQIVPNIPVSLLSHFYRGFFDGDGITDIGKTKHYRSGFIATEDIIQTLQMILDTHCKHTHPKNTSADCKIYTVLFGRRDSRKLYNFVYTNATVWCSRKRKRMDIICGNTEIIV